MKIAQATEGGIGLQPVGVFRPEHPERLRIEKIPFSLCKNPVKETHLGRHDRLVIHDILFVQSVGGVVDSGAADRRWAAPGSRGALPVGGRALNTILLTSLAPLAIVALSWLALGERISRVQGLGLLTSLGGAVVLILHGDAEALVSLRFNAGDLWMLLAVALWTVYSVLLRRRPEHVPPLALHTASVGAGTLWMLPLFGWEAVRGAGLPTALSAWLAIGFVAVFSSAIAHALWVRGVASIGPNRASVFIHLMPLFGAVLAITFLGEEVAAYHVLGAALVLVGVILSSRKWRRRSAAGAAAQPSSVHVGGVGDATRLKLALPIEPQ